MIDKYFNNKKIPFTKISNEVIDLKIKEKIDIILKKESYILGEEVLLFENNYSNYSGIKYCVGVGNGTDALELALRASGVSYGDRVVVPTNSFAATALAPIRIGAIPVFVDCDKYGLMDIEQASKIDAKAYIPVHLYGQLCNVKKLRECVGNNKIIVEDAAQSHGAENDNYRSGEYSDIVATSFYPTKNLGCFGDGGAILTNSDFYFKKIKELRNYGSIEKYHHDAIGFNSRLDEIQAGILNIKLSYLNDQNNLRINAAKIYNNLLSSFIKIPEVNSGNKHVYHLYVIESEERDLCSKFLDKIGIETKIHYPIPLHLQPAFFYLGYRLGDFPNSEYLSKKILSIPMFPGINYNDQEFVAYQLKKFYETL